jgi:hypothetical protein
MGQPMQSESLHPSSVAVTSEEAGAVFQSILHFPDSVQYETRRQPDFFSDLNLDQIIEAITAHKRRV